MRQNSSDVTEIPFHGTTVPKPPQYLPEGPKCGGITVKMMVGGDIASPAALSRFHAEAQLAASLHHPNIVPIYEIGEAEGRLYFSMEFIQGRTLAELARGTPLAPERSARYVREIATAIHYAHQKGILHRDLKPSNVLIDETDSPRITDFGLAKSLDSSQSFGAGRPAMALVSARTALGESGH